MAVKGVFASDAGITGARKGDFTAALMQIMPTGRAPLLALSSGMQSAPAHDTIITWFEENHLASRSQDSGSGYNASTTTIDVLDASYVVAGDILLAEATSELIFVTSVTGNSLTVERGFAGSTAASGSASAYFQKIGTAFEEGSSRPTAVANLGYPVFNYMQIFRNSWDITGTARAVDYYTGDQVAKNKADALLFHAEDIERSLWFGRRAIGVRNSKPFRTMNGLRAIITTNVESGDNQMQYSEIDAWLQTIFQRNIKGKPNERIAFMGNTALATFNYIAIEMGSAFNISPSTTEFGLDISTWISPYGRIVFMTHPLFVENPTWTKDIDVLHPGAMRTRWLRQTHEDDYNSDGTRAGVDADYGVITSEMSLEYAAEKTGGRYTGIIGASTTQP